jgi:hypothetical protein
MMSGSNDILAQSLLAQVRQRPQQSVQSRLAAQMLQQSQSNEPIYNGNAGIALRAGQGLLAGFLSQYAQRGDDDREAKRVYNAEQYQAQRDRAADAEMQPLLDAVRGGIGGAARPAPAEAPAMPGPVAQAPLPASAPAGDPSLPRGLRNNNPLNLSYVEGQPGVLGSDGRFGRYATPEDGIAASVRQLQMYGQRGLTTLPQIINRWAPPSENDTGAYVSRVAQAAGLPTDQPLNLQDPDTLTRLVGAMATVENGRGIDPTVARRGVDAGLALPVNGAPAAAGGSPPPALPPPGPGQGAPPPPAGVDFRALAVQAAASRNPRAQGLAPLLMQMATANERPATSTAAPGSAILDRSGRIVGNVPDRPQQPGETERLLAQYERLQALGDNATPAEAQRRDLLARRIGGAGNNVTVDQRGQSTYEQERGKGLASEEAAIRQGGTSARQTLARLGDVERNLDRFTTGVTSETRMRVGQIANMIGVPTSVLQTLGIDPNTVAAGEQIRSQASAMLQGLLGPGGFPSANFSDADRQMLERALPGLVNSPTGNRAIVQTMRLMAQRQTDIATAWNDWRRQPGNGSGMESFDRFQQERLPQITSQDVLAPLLQDAFPVADQPGQATVPGPNGGTAAPPAARAAAPGGQGGGWGIRPVR